MFQQYTIIIGYMFAPGDESVLSKRSQFYLFSICTYFHTSEFAHLFVTQATSFFFFFREQCLYLIYIPIGYRQMC